MYKIYSTLKFIAYVADLIDFDHDHAIWIGSDLVNGAFLMGLTQNYLHSILAAAGFRGYLDF